MPILDLEGCQRALAEPDLISGGSVTRVTGDTIEASLACAQTGAIYCIPGEGNREDLLTEVIGFRNENTILAPFGSPRGIGPGDSVLPEGLTDEQEVSDAVMGRILDAFGRPLDAGPPLTGKHRVPLYRQAPNPLQREPIKEVLATGIAALDGMITVGRGQRLGIFAGAGVGKSTLLGMIARFSEADVNVICLVGERGREVRGFIEQELGEEGLARSVVLVAAGDQAPILRMRVAFLATTLAEYFRDKGRKVLLLMDSITRLAQAMREIGLSAGEPPTTRGYTPSVFSTLPKLVERAGNSEGRGTMTAFYTVLVDGDDMTEPVADTMRGLLDGHILLSRRLAEAGHFPAIDISGSLSRLAVEIIDKPHMELSRRVREVFNLRNEVADLLQVGAYQKGSDPETDRAIQLFPKLADFFMQERSEFRPFESTLGGLQTLLGP